MLDELTKIKNIYDQMKVDLRAKDARIEELNALLERWIAACHALKVPTGVQYDAKGLRYIVTIGDCRITVPNYMLIHKELDVIGATS